jgi:NAD(P)-dependent dehydrogenase (short-subunit alcohol dehydrogenase family)
MRALVIGVAGGIGAALATTLAQKGEVIGLSRADGLDITDEASITEVLGAVSGQFDLIFIATGALAAKSQNPEKSLRALNAHSLAAQFAVNAIGPALLVKHLIRLIPKDRPAHLGVLSARVGSIGDNALGGWYSYRASKAALNQLIHTAAIELARSHPLLTLACLHPGTVATNFSADYAAAKFPPALAAAQLIDVLTALTPTQTGGFYDWAGKQVVW